MQHTIKLQKIVFIKKYTIEQFKNLTFRFTKPLYIATVFVRSNNSWKCIRFFKIQNFTVKLVRECYNIVILIIVYVSKQARIQNLVPGTRSNIFCL